MELVAGGRQLVMPVPRGRARCEGDPEAEFEAVVRFADGSEVRAPAPENHAGTIERLHDRECAAAEVQAATDISLGPLQRGDGFSMQGELVLEQVRPGAQAQVVEITGSVIFSLVLKGAGPAVSAEQQRSAVPVVIRAERCDPHALSESKHTFDFEAWIALDGAEPVVVPFEPDEEAQRQLEQVLAECGP